MGNMCTDVRVLRFEGFFECSEDPSKGYSFGTAIIKAPLPC